MSFILLNEFNKGISLKKTIIKTNTVPQAVSTNIGNIYMWVGDTNSDFIHGYIYECKLDGSNNIIFERINVQPNETGSADYDDLSNKPQINGVTLSGNKTGLELGLVPETITRDTASITLDILANKNYEFTSNALTDITFTSCEKSKQVTTIEFTTGSSNVTFTDNSGIDWADGETPVFYAYQKYTIVIFNKTGYVLEDF